MSSIMSVGVGQTLLAPPPPPEQSRHWNHRYIPQKCRPPSYLSSQPAGELSSLATHPGRRAYGPPAHPGLIRPCSSAGQSGNILHLYQIGMYQFGWVMKHELLTTWSWHNGGLTSLPPAQHRHIIIVTSAADWFLTITLQYLQYL